MMNEHVQLFFNASISFVAALTHLYYVIKHSNGKRNLRLISFGIMIYFTAIQFAAAMDYLSIDTYGAEYLRPWMPVLYLIPVFDVIVDFKKKTIQKGE